MRGIIVSRGSNDSILAHRSPSEYGLMKLEARKEREPPPRCMRPKSRESLVPMTALVWIGGRVLPRPLLNGNYSSETQNAS